jgi:hypothetical protein
LGVHACNPVVAHTASEFDSSILLAAQSESKINGSAFFESPVCELQSSQIIVNEDGLWRVELLKG